MTATDPNLRTVQLTWDSGLLFHGGTEGAPSVPVDADVKAGPGPMHNLLLAVGACSGADVVSILKKMQVGLSRCDIEVSGRRAEEHPKRYLSLKLAFRIAGTGLDETKARRAIELSLTKYCSVIHSLNPDIPVTYDLTLVDA
jgi:putative redox protein